MNRPVNGQIILGLIQLLKKPFLIVIIIYTSSMQNISFIELIKNVLAPYSITSKHISYGQTYEFIKNTVTSLLNKYTIVINKLSNQYKRKKVHLDKKIQFQ